MAEIPATVIAPVVPDPNGSVVPPKDDPATTGVKVPDGYELIKTEDKSNLISARDRANEQLKQASGGDDLLIEIAKEREIGKFISDNKAKYPDLTKEDLMYVDDPDRLAAEAERMQRRFEDITQAKLKSVQIADHAPLLSEAQKSEQLNALRNNGKSDSFEKMIEIRSS